MSCPLCTVREAKPADPTKPRTRRDIADELTEAARQKTLAHCSLLASSHAVAVLRQELRDYDMASLGRGRP